MATKRSKSRAANNNKTPVKKTGVPTAAAAGDAISPKLRSFFASQPNILQSLGMTEAEYQSFTAFSQLPPEERLKTSREIVTEFVIKASTAKEPRFPLAVKESES